VQGLTVRLGHVCAGHGRSSGHLMTVYKRRR
jgi:hypothetical protein